MCESPVAATARFCSTCGVELAKTGSAGSRAPARPAKWYHNIWIVLVLLFVVLGPFGLPLVWTNPRFSRATKLVLTALTVAYTTALIALTARMVAAVTGQMDQLDTLFTY